jgi:dihydroxyacetone kinase
MTPQEALAWLDEALAGWATHAPELRDLDAAVGDGDLGVTVARGVTAVRSALAQLGAEPRPADVCRAAGVAFAKGSPSTMSALVGSGLLAAAKAIPPDATYDQAAAVATLRTLIDTIAERGHATIGDKTVLDALAPSLIALQSATGRTGEEVLNEMALAAERGVAQTTEAVARRGRAAWVGERTAGHRDPGAVAYALLLRSLQRAWPDHIPVEQ